MKKILTFAGIAILFVLLSAPLNLKASNENVIGTALIRWNNVAKLVNVYTIGQYDVTSIYVSGGTIYGSNQNNSRIFLYNDADGLQNQLFTDQTYSVYIPTITSNITWNGGQSYNDRDEFENSLPVNLRPTWSEKLWDALFERYKNIYGFYPIEGSFLYEMAKANEDDIDLSIIFPTNAPTPTPTPSPTPIPVQTIYVPSGNGNYTIIYQYPDLNGNITQSPYNPNVEVNVDVDCDCDNGNNYNPQDPMYYPFDGLTWASVDGNLTGSPAMSAGQSLDLIKSEVDSYDEPIKVVSNSFGALPGKWLGLVGLLGACLIVAGLIRTFLGG